MIANRSITAGASRKAEKLSAATRRRGQNSDELVWVEKMSNRLQEKLPIIACYLMFIGMEDFPIAGLASFNANLLSELGSILMAICTGQEARRLFRQNERTKPRRKSPHLLALVYWYFRACSSDVADDSQAIERVRTATRLDAPKSAATIRKIAQGYRDFALNYLEDYSRSILELPPPQLFVYNLVRTLEPVSIYDIEDAQVSARVNRLVEPLDVVKVASLREYLRKKCARPDLDK